MEDASPRGPAPPYESMVMNTPLDASMNYKKLLATAVFTLGVWMSAGVANAQYTFNTNVGSTNYNFEYVSGSYVVESSYFNTTYMPWWGSQSAATTFATAVGG